MPSIVEKIPGQYNPAFVLVPGGWHGGWCFRRVADILRARGHAVFTPTLTGLGERAHLANLGPIDCSMHIQDVINVIRWERLTDVVLCGHSYGGMIIGGAADALSERVRSLVYLDAIIPSNGCSAIEDCTPDQWSEFVRMAGTLGGRLLPAPPAEVFNVNEADREMVDALCTPHPFASLVECISLSGAYMTPKKIYIHATDWAGSPNLLKAYQFARGSRDWRTIEITCSHEIMLDKPVELADILCDAV